MKKFIDKKETALLAFLALTGTLSPAQANSKYKELQTASKQAVFVYDSEYFQTLYMSEKPLWVKSSLNEKRIPAQYPMISRSGEGNTDFIDLADRDGAASNCGGGVEVNPGDCGPLTPSLVPFISASKTFKKGGLDFFELKITRHDQSESTFLDAPACGMELRMGADLRSGREDRRIVTHQESINYIKAVSKVLPTVALKHALSSDYLLKLANFKSAPSSDYSRVGNDSLKVTYSRGTEHIYRVTSAFEFVRSSQGIQVLSHNHLAKLNNPSNETTRSDLVGILPAHISLSDIQVGSMRDFVSEDADFRDRHEGAIQISSNGKTYILAQLPDSNREAPRAAGIVSNIRFDVDNVTRKEKYSDRMDDIRHQCFLHATIWPSCSDEGSGVCVR